MPPQECWPMVTKSTLLVAYRHRTDVHGFAIACMSINPLLSLFKIKVCCGMCFENIFRPFQLTKPGAAGVHCNSEIFDRSLRLTKFVRKQIFGNILETDRTQKSSDSQTAD